MNREDCRFRNFMLCKLRVYCFM